jgi:hypothetical protein
MAAARPFLFDGSQECHLPPKLRRNDNARGHRIRVWGGESPSQTDYDSLGRMTYLHTWRTGTWNSSTWSPPPPASLSGHNPVDLPELSVPPAFQKVS